MYKRQAFLRHGTGISLVNDDSQNTLTISATIVDTNTQLTTEQVQDIVGSMFTGNTESGIIATYDDPDGKINLTVPGAVAPPPSSHQRYGAIGSDNVWSAAEMVAGAGSTTSSLTLSGATGREYVAFWSANQLTVINPVNRRG